VKILETERTILREVTAERDSEFILDLLNQPSFIKYIGDRNVRTVEAAREYVESRFAASYAQFGFGMYAVELKETGEIIGICGFVKRDTLPQPDIGFAFLQPFEGKGFGFETSSQMMRYGKDVLGFERVLAITTRTNAASVKLLEKLNFKFERLIEVAGEQLNLFSIDL
jgi:RimJ/RimL family protein N-acetyltransferase